MERAYKIPSKPNEIGIRNYERVPEDELLLKIIRHLKKNPDVLIGNKEELVYIDLYKGSLAGQSFSLVMDLDYGLFVRCENERTAEALIDAINQE